MSCIHFKFKCDKKFDSVVFDGASCTLAELKKLVIQKKGLSKHALDFDLLINNAQTKQVYSKSNDVIQRNSSVIVARIPAGGTHCPIDSAIEEDKPLTLSKLLEESAPEEFAQIVRNNGGPSNKSASNDFWLKKVTGDQSTSSSGSNNSCVPEADELAAISNMHSRETCISNGSRRNQFINGSVPHPSYVCHRCNRTGHFKHVCPLLLEGDQLNQPVAPAIKRATGIPRSELIPLKSHVPGAYITSEGTYAIPRKDAEAILNADKVRPWDRIKDNFSDKTHSESSYNQSIKSENPPPAQLSCLLCKDLFIDAVMTPCCNENFCDTCIRNRLLESDGNECPSCHQKDIPLDQIFANKFLRETVSMYGKRKSDTVSSLFDQREPDLDQALTASLPRNSDRDNCTDIQRLIKSESSHNADEKYDARLSHSRLDSSKSRFSEKTKMENQNNSHDFNQKSISSCYSQSCSDMIDPYGLNTKAINGNGSSTLAAAAAAAAAALFIPSISTLGSFNSQIGLKSDNGRSYRNHNSNIHRVHTSDHNSNFDYNQNNKRDFKPNITSSVLSKDQFELIKHTLSGFNISSRIEQKNDVQSSLGDSNNIKQPSPAKCTDDLVNDDKSCSSVYSNDRVICSRENERIINEDSDCHSPLHEEQSDSDSKHRLKRSSRSSHSSHKKRSTPHRERSIQRNGNDLAKSDGKILNVLEYCESSKDCIKIKKSSKSTKENDCEKHKSREKDSLELNEDREKFPLKPRLVSYVHSVNRHCSIASNEKTKSCIDKSSSFSESKKDRKRSRHKSSKKGKKHHRKCSSSSGSKKRNKKHVKKSADKKQVICVET